MAGLYAQLYGTDVRAEAQCSHCRVKYEIRFDLTALQDSRRPDSSASATGSPPELTLGQSRLRLPCQSDLDGAPEDFLRRLTLDGPVPGHAEAAAALEAADPALELDLSGTWFASKTINRVSPPH